jgi:hypothetical protein
MSEPLLLGAEAERPGDVLHVLELLPLGQPAELAQDVVGGIALLRLGDERVAVGGPHLLAQGLGQRGATLDVALVGTGGRGGLVRVGHGSVSSARGRQDVVEASV